MNPRTSLVAAVMAASTVLAACSTESPSPEPPSTTVSIVASVALPPPDQRGPQITVEGRVTWTTSHPGCPELETLSGQRFHLTGAVATEHEGHARAGQVPGSQHVQITGYVPESGASVCPARRAFVTEKVAAVDR